MIQRAVEKLTAPMRRRVAMMVGRVTVKLVNDALKMQGVQITLLADEALDGVERIQNYGFTSNPQPEAEGVALAVGGSRNHMVVIACDDRRYRLTGLQSGEVAVYTDEGDKIVLKRGRTIEVTAGTKVQVNAPLVEMSGDLKVDGNIVAVGDISDHTNKSMAGMRAVYNGHTHNDPQGGVVGAPNQAM